MTEIYCVVCGNFTRGKEAENGEGICAKCEEQVEQIEQIATDELFAEKYDAHA